MRQSDSNDRHSGKVDTSSKPPDVAGAQKVENTLFSKFIYNEAEYHEMKEAGLEDCLAERDDSCVVWIDVEGVRPLENIKAMGEHFHFHSLTIEGIVNTRRRPRMEDYGHYIFVGLKDLVFDEKRDAFRTEQISLAYGENFVITFQEGFEGDGFDSIREEIRTESSRVRKMKADYLAYALMDAVVDNYFLILERLGDRIEELEEKLIATPTPVVIRQIHRLKRSMVDMRRALWPLREEIGLLEKVESPIIQPTTKIFLRDLYEHTIEVIDTVEIYHDILSGMHDTYLSSISNRMNEIMKVLTIISTIFIPLTFIAGMYGMNFDNMPELRWQWGYFAVLGLMAIVAGVMIRYFKKKKWL